MQEDKNYCVYLHRNKKTNEVFYVGSGRPSRASSATGRSAKWLDIVKLDGFVFEIIEDNLDKKSSLVKESDKYSELVEKFDLVNFHKPVVLNPYPIDEIFKRLEYNEDSPTCLVWKTDSFGGYHHQSKLITKGTSAGSNPKNNYCVVPLAGRTLSSHRVVWILNHGSIQEEMYVDHIAGNKANNKISNLRLVSAKENIRNRSRRTDNKYGFAGVSINHRKNRTSRWRAFYYDLDGKQIWKCFSISKYGNDEAFRLACEWRSEQIRLLNEQGAGYTERHGT